MPVTVPIRATFNAGELSPLMSGRVDVSKYLNGAKTMQNFIPSVQGPAVRRGGSRFVAEVKNSNNRTWLSIFEFNVNQSYVLEWGDKYLRFYFTHGQLLIDPTQVSAWSSATTYAVGNLVSYGGVYYYCQAASTNNTPSSTSTYWYALTGQIYEIPTPYAIADLTDTTDNTLVLDMVQTGDIIYICHPNYPTYKLSRFGHTNWTLAPVTFKNGPFKTQNIDKTINVYATGTTGTVTIYASSAIFNANHVGSYFYMEPADLSRVKPWFAGEQFSTNPYGVYRRSNGCTYMCVTNATPASGYVFETGGNTPIHTYGVEADGDGNGVSGTVASREGLDWLFVDNGRGYVKITGYVSPTQVTAVVSGDYPLPIGVQGASMTGTTASGSNTITGLTGNVSALAVGMEVTGPGIPAGTTIQSISGTSVTINQNCTASATVTIWFSATFVWAFGSFSAVEGYPSKVTFFRGRLTLAKGQTLYFSVSQDFENFAATDDTGNVVADRAIQATIASDQTNRIEWLMPTMVLLVGTSGQEFACAENTTSEAFAPANVKIDQQTAEGSRAIKPVRVGYSTLFVQRSGRKLKECAYDFRLNSYVSNDMTILAEHITVGGIQQIAWHKEPYVCCWAVRGDGQLLGFTYNKEQDVLGWHRHILGGSYNGGQAVVESVCVIPAPDKTRDDAWLIVKRTINGVTKRYIEWMDHEYQDGDAQTSCYYVDCGLSYNGTPVSTLTGLNHLIGQTVSVLADGSAHPDCVVNSNGSITLQRAASVVHAGFGYVSDLQLNRIEAGAGDGGTAQGKTKRIARVGIRFYNTLGAKAGPDVNSLDLIDFRSGSTPMDQAPPLYTGDKMMEWPSGYDLDGYVMVRQDQPLPMTIVALMPQIETFERV
jgi:hypothetical protein